MNLYDILFGIMPLLIFVIIDTIGGLKSGVIAAIICALAEIIYSLFVYQTIDAFSLGSGLLVLVLGFFSLRSDKPIYIKLQPVVLGLVFALVFLVLQLFGKPLLPLMVEKYQYMLPENYRSAILNPIYTAMLARLSGILGFAFLLHAGLVAYAAFYLNKWWWISIRGPGFYLVLILCMLYVRFF
jgi:intracellular septation protein A